MKDESEFSREVGKKEERKVRSRRKRRSIWFGFGVFGLVGWSVAVPTLLGVALGRWMDKHWPGQISWTLTCLILGAIVGSFNAWHLVKRELRRKNQ